MTDTKRGPGAPKKDDSQKKVRATYTLPKKTVEWLDAQPDGKRSQIVENALELYRKVLDGKVKFTEPTPNEQQE